MIANKAHLWGGVDNLRGGNRLLPGIDKGYGNALRHLVTWSDGNGGAPVFHKDSDYTAFLDLPTAAKRIFP